MPTHNNTQTIQHIVVNMHYSTFKNIYKKQNVSFSKGQTVRCGFFFKEIRLGIKMTENKIPTCE